MILAISAPTGSTTFVDLDVHPYAWIGLVLLILALLGIDLYRHREAHAPTTRQAAMESLIWVSCGLIFSMIVALGYGSEAFSEYISGYLIEKSLSVDNVFVWSMLFTTLSIPVRYQHRVLFWGIFGALALRAVFILVGTALITRFWWLLLVFGFFLIFTGLKIIRHRADEGEDTSTRGLGLLRRVMPVSNELDGQRFVTRINGRRAATPLLAALFVIEVTDIIFAAEHLRVVGRHHRRVDRGHRAQRATGEADSRLADPNRARRATAARNEVSPGVRRCRCRRCRAPRGPERAPPLPRHRHRCWRGRLRGRRPNEASRRRLRARPGWVR